VKRVFVDTSAWIAYAKRDDKDHGPVSGTLDAWEGRLVTSDYVFDETVTFVRARLGHPAALRVGEILRDPGVVELVRVTEEDEEDAWAWFKRHKDKVFSFTDCASFALMRRLRVHAAVATDRHFRQAGFQVLP
jgi:uncharacterized protein